MSCLCLLHIFTQMIVMEMIMCLSLHIKREAAPQLSVWDANREMFYGLRHTEESKGGVMAGYTTPSRWSRHLAHSLHLFLLFCDSSLAEMGIYGTLHQMLNWAPTFQEEKYPGFHPHVLQMLTEFAENTQVNLGSCLLPLCKYLQLDALLLHSGGVKWLQRKREQWHYRNKRPPVKPQMVENHLKDILV